MLYVTVCYNHKAENFQEKRRMASSPADLLQIYVCLRFDGNKKVLSSVLEARLAIS